MEPKDADGYFGRVSRESPSGTRLARAQSVNTYFTFPELRHKVEIRQLTGRVVDCPIDGMNRLCAAELYLNGLDLLSIQEILGRSWIATTMRDVHVHRTRVEDAWAAGNERAAKRLEGLNR
ncbi:site-specific integrase [Embleya sp. NBC_00888]|uniref:hypothetical protein n=1 Tax=Embleya sp. NBC_00888 TaxID=2975960 RepID=UPI00386AF3F1|nr:site-specific integrase [Embleya sp. NBC_00888]